MNVIAVLVLGAIGGIFRFALEPFGAAGTMLVNVMGAFALGFFAKALSKNDTPEWIRVGVGSGLIGSMTTFSVLISDAQRLMDTRLWMGVAYVATSVIGGMLFCCIGGRLAQFQGSGRELQPDSGCNQQDAGENRGALAQLLNLKPSANSRGDS